MSPVIYNDTVVKCSGALLMLELYPLDGDNTRLCGCAIIN